MSNPSVAFVILTWNSGTVIGRCLQTVFDSSDICPYVVVVDNGSTDDSVAIVESFNDQYGVTLIKLAENLGTTLPRNIALKALPREIEYVCILDSDTAFSSDAIAKLIRVLESDDTIGIVGPALVGKDGLTQLSARNFPTVQEKILNIFPFKSFQAKAQTLEKPEGFSDRGLLNVDYLLSACWVARRQLFDQVGCLDEAIFYAPEDVEFCMRVHKAQLRIVYCPEIVIHHDYQRISHKKLLSRHNLEHIKGLVYYFKKYHYLFDSSKARCS